METAIAIAGLLITIALGILSWVQWQISETAKQRQDEIERERQEKVRDSDLTDWGMRVIDVITRIRLECLRPQFQERPRKETAMGLECEASVLVDQGRLFFPNIAISGTRVGHRPQLLDEVLRAVYIARALANNSSDISLLHDHAWEVRNRFISLLQEKTRLKLYDAPKTDRGVSLSHDPAKWPTPRPR